MEPRIQYAQTTDGVSIAYWTLGKGTPFVYLPSSPITSTQSARQMPDVRRWYDRLAAEWMLVRYDPRGGGLSDREVADLSLDRRLLDLEAVADSLSLGRFVIFAYGLAGPQAIAYAARNPERVAHLLLWCTSSQPSEVVDVARLNAVLALADVDWELCTNTLSSDLMGWSVGEEARRSAAYLRESGTPALLKAGLEAMVQVDVTDLLPQVKSPTLVMHRRGVRAPGLDGARRLASRIPHARLAMLDGEDRLPFRGDTEAVLAAINEFLGEGEETPAGAEPAGPGAFRTVLFTDLVGHTEMMQRLGDQRGREVLREHESITRNVLKQYGGAEVKSMGDGFMASFGSVTKAVECAVALQRAFAEREGEPLSVRVGLNAGEPIEEDGDLFGSTVILASRIAAQAREGEILIPEPVRHLLSGKPFVYADRGEFVPKGFDDAVRLYKVRWQGEGSP